jgi:hypothetical protein
MSLTVYCHVINFMLCEFKKKIKEGRQSEGGREGKREDRDKDVPCGGKGGICVQNVESSRTRNTG